MVIKKESSASFLKIGRYKVPLTHQEKILFPEPDITKGDVISYYQTVAPYMLPFIKNHLLTMQRYPQGIEHEGFFHKNAPDYFPSWIKTVCLQKKEAQGSTCYVVGTTAAGLLYLINYNTLVLHSSLSTIDTLEYPDRMIFDLDPQPGVSFRDVIWAAFELKKVLEQLNLTPFVMLTGSRGVHVVAPLKPCTPFKEVHNFALSIASYLAHHYPERLTVEFSKKDRGNTIFIDTLRNQYGATAVVPYSLRATPMSSVALPVAWEELKKIPSSDFFTLSKALTYLEKRGSLWTSFDKKRYTLPQIKNNF